MHGSAWHSPSCVKALSPGGGQSLPPPRGGKQPRWRRRTFFKNNYKKATFNFQGNVAMLSSPPVRRLRCRVTSSAIPAIAGPLGGSELFFSLGNKIWICVGAISNGWRSQIDPPYHKEGKIFYRKNCWFLNNFAWNRTIWETFLHTLANYWVLCTLWDQARDAEVAEGVLGEVGPQHLKINAQKNAKTDWADAPLSHKKMPTKKHFFCFLKKSFIGLPLPLNEFRAGMDMGKKRWLVQKTEREKKSCFAPHKQFFHTVGDSRTFKTSNSFSGHVTRRQFR